MISAKPAAGSQPSEGQFPFWDHPERWPHDPPGYVFLARACHEVGRAMFGAEWAASWGEPAEPPDDCDLATWEAYERQCDECQNAFVAMRSDVVRTIADECEAGKLISAVRPKAGGQMIKVEQHLWNGEGVERRFHKCEMSLNDPFGTGGGSYGSYWIYIERASLEGVLSHSHQDLPLQNAAASTPDTAPKPKRFNLPRAHRLQLGMETALEIYPNGLPLGETEALFLKKVREHLRNSGKGNLSDSTLRRAKTKLSEWTQARAQLSAPERS